jgi:hypothetical protein
MLSRRLFFPAAAMLALSGCASLEASPVVKWLSAGLKYDVTVIRAAALSLEQAIANAAKNGGAAVATDAAYIAANPGPFCQLIVEMDQMAQAAVSTGILPVSDATGAVTPVGLAAEILHDLATNSTIVAAANTGAIPASPMALASSIITTAAQIKTATAGTAKPVTPTAAAASVAAKPA